MILVTYHAVDLTYAYEYLNLGPMNGVNGFGAKWVDAYHEKGDRVGVFMQVKPTDVAIVAMSVQMEPFGVVDIRGLSSQTDWAKISSNTELTLTNVTCKVPLSVAQVRDDSD